MPGPNLENSNSPRQLSPEVYARLRAEVAAPYRGLRQFIYVTLGLSGFIGAVIFLAQLVAGQDMGRVLPNLALQIGVVALMIGLYRLEQRGKKVRK